MATAAPSFTGRAPTVRATYDALLNAAEELGPFAVDPKKTSVHLNRRTAFAGNALRKDALVLTLKSAQEIPSARPQKQEQASAGRWYVYVRLTDPAEVDAELRGWLAHSYAESA